MLRPAHILMTAATALLALAVVMVWSARMTVGGEGLAFVQRQVIYAVLAFVAMLVGSRLNVREVFRARGFSSPLIIMLLVSFSLAVLTLVPGMGRSVNGASRWLEIGPVSFQPSELVKWSIVIAMAWWCARRGGVMHRFADGLLPALLLLALAVGVVGAEDLGTSALIAAVGALVLIAGGARLRHLMIFVPPAVAALVAMIIMAPYRVQRVLAFLNPWDDPQGVGYHPIQSMLAVTQGGLFGRGLGNGVQKFGYLPEDSTDFIFAIICEEMGLVGALMVIGAYLVILWIGLGIVRQCQDAFGRLLGLGVLLTVGLQAALNIAVVTAMVPTKGIALPLISSGGTGWIVTAFALGLVASLDNAYALHIDGREASTRTMTPATTAPMCGEAELI
ncbi:MAG: cell division protein FtsW [Phycisphaeraceae bacterium]|nr:cell division protein FtsW [Phycisphaeraceae bacterium]